MPGQEPHGLSEAAELGELTPQQQVPPPGSSDVSRVRRLALRAICCHTLAPGLRKALLIRRREGLWERHAWRAKTFQGTKVQRTRRYKPLSARFVFLRPSSFYPGSRPPMITSRTHTHSRHTRTRLLACLLAFASMSRSFALLVPLDPFVLVASRPV